MLKTVLYFCVKKKMRCNFFRDSLTNIKFRRTAFHNIFTNGVHTLVTLLGAGAEITAPSAGPSAASTLNYINVCMTAVCDTLTSLKKHIKNF